MKVSIAKLLLDHGQPLEVVTDLVLHRNANATMQLHAALPDKARRAADL
jgi:hypothetical protein